MAHVAGPLKSHFNTQVSSTVEDVTDRPTLLTYLSVTNVNAFDVWLWIYDVEADDVVTVGSLSTLPWALFAVPGSAGGDAGMHIEDFNSPLELQGGFSYLISSSHETVHVLSGQQDCIVQFFYR